MNFTRHDNLVIILMDLVIILMTLVPSTLFPQLSYTFNLHFSIMTVQKMDAVDCWLPIKSTLDG